MKLFIIYRNRILKFLDNPIAFFPFIRKKLFYNFISDLYIQSYDKYSFLDYSQTLKKSLHENVSIIRFGDEVIDMTLGIRLYFNDWRQKYEKNLSKRLKEILQTREKNILLCFNPELILKNKKAFKDLGIKNEHQFWTHSKVYLKKYLQEDQIYGRALTFHPRYNKSLNIAEIIFHLKKKHLIIVTSNTERFNNAQLGITTHYIEAPSSDAWSKYETLLKQTLSAAKKTKKNETLVLSSMGPAAKVLIYDLNKLGYTGWDTGQFFDLMLDQIL